MLNGFTPIYSQFGTDIYSSDVVQQAINCIVSELKKLNPQHIRKTGYDSIPINSSIQKEPAVKNNKNIAKQNKRK